MGYIAEAGWTVVVAFVGLVSVRVTSRRQSRLTYRRDLLEILVLKYLVARDVETGAAGFDILKQAGRENMEQP